MKEKHYQGHAKANINLKEGDTLFESAQEEADFRAKLPTVSADAVILANNKHPQVVDALKQILPQLKTQIGNLCAQHDYPVASLEEFGLLLIGAGCTALICHEDLAKEEAADNNISDPTKPPSFQLKANPRIPLN
jgi:hypothetical protein